MKNFCTSLSTFLFLLISLSSFAQTKLIALKSRSGSMETLVVNSSDNFGIRYEEYDSYNKINDSVIIHIKTISFNSSDTMAIDTITSHEFLFNDTLSTEDKRKKLVEKYGYSRYIFVGFDEEIKRINKGSIFSILDSKYYFYLLLLIILGFIISSVKKHRTSS